ncbi:unnamed protein product [Arctogadus glacialis]
MPRQWGAATSEVLIDGVKAPPGLSAPSHWLSHLTWPVTDAQRAELAPHWQACVDLPSDSIRTALQVAPLAGENLGPAAQLSVPQAEIKVLGLADRAWPWDGAPWQLLSRNSPSMGSWGGGLATEDGRGEEKEKCVPIWARPGRLSSPPYRWALSAPALLLR